MAKKNNNSHPSFNDKFASLGIPIKEPEMNLDSPLVINTDEENELIEANNKRELKRGNFMVAIQMAQKEILLFEYYDVEMGNWEELGRKLIVDYIPGFTVNKKKKAGRKKKWNDLELLRLYRDVKHHLKLLQKVNPALTSSDACRELTHKYKAKDKVLLNKYAEAQKSPFVHLFKCVKKDSVKSEAETEKMLDNFFETLKKAYYTDSRK